MREPPNCRLWEEGRVPAFVLEAGDADNGADVSRATCERSGDGAASLCAVWTDPDFDPSRSAVYYARVVENPSCRWNALQCAARPEDERPAACMAPELPWRIQERAWTSPILVPGLLRSSWSQSTYRPEPIAPGADAPTRHPC